MSHDSISNWVERAKLASAGAVAENALSAIDRESSEDWGSDIMKIAERLRPWLAKMYEGVRDENGMLVQPARIRGIALNLAQYIVKEQKQ